MQCILVNPFGTHSLINYDYLVTLLVLLVHFEMIPMIDLFAVNICSRDILVELEKGEKIVNIDNDYMDPQLYATFAGDIYKHLRASEVWLHFTC